MGDDTLGMNEIHAMHKKSLDNICSLLVLLNISMKTFRIISCLKDASDVSEVVVFQVFRTPMVIIIKKYHITENYNIISWTTLELNYIQMFYSLLQMRIGWQSWWKHISWDWLISVAPLFVPSEEWNFKMCFSGTLLST